MCGLKTRRGAGKLAPAEMRSKEWWMMIYMMAYSLMLTFDPFKIDDLEIP